MKNDKSGSSRTEAADAAGIAYHVRVEAEGRVADLLAETTALSKHRIKDAMTKGAVWVTRGRRTTRVRRGSAAAQAGDEVHLYYHPRVLGADPTPCALVSDEGDYSVWDKPYGMRSQGSKWGDHCTVVRWAERHLKPERPAFTVHRLDRAATGLMLLAHGKRMATRLAKLFESRDVEKRYEAVVHGRFGDEERELTAPIEGRDARTRVRGMRYDPDADRSVVAVEIETGRKHQIRKHLSGIGHPVVGDRMYGRDGDPENLQLRAVRLSFVCPISSERKTFVAHGVVDPVLRKRVNVCKTM